MARKGELYNPEYPPGSQPPMSFYNEKQGGRDWNIIDDNRTPFASGVFATMGIPPTAYDIQKKTLRLDSSQQAMFDQVKAIVENIPYFEIDRKFARFGSAELKAIGCQSMLRPRWANNLDGGVQDFIVMAPDQTTWAKGQQIAQEKSRAKDEQIQTLTDAQNAGELQEDLIQEDLGMDVGAFMAALQGGEISIPQAERAINTFAPADAKLLKQIKELAAEGRLNPYNTNVDLDNLDGITKRDAYGLRDKGQKAASNIERAEVQALLTLEYHSKKIPANLDELTSADARNFKREVSSMLTPDQRDILTQAGRNAARQGGFGGSTTGVSGKPILSAREASSSYVAEKAAEHGADHHEIGTGMVAIEVVAATPHHVHGFTDPAHTRSTTIETTGATDELRARLDKLSNNGTGEPLADRFLVASSAKGRAAVLMSTKQESHEAAAAEAVGIATAKNSLGKANVEILGPSETPASGRGMVVSMVDQPFVALLDENKLVTVAKDNIKGNPVFFQQVEYANASPDANRELVAAAPARKRGRG
jgi:hypothetical protein